MNNFNEFVKLWQGQTKKVKVKKEYSHLLFLIVYLLLLILYSEVEAVPLSEKTIEIGL